MEWKDKKPVIPATPKTVPALDFTDADTTRPIVLHRWHLIMIGTNYHLVGLVTGHPRFKDGDRIRTSSVVKYMPALKMAETRNTLYFLGEQAH